MGQIIPHYPVEFYPMDPNKYGTNYTISLVILPHGSKQEFNSPRYTTFNKVYQTRWRDVLRFRDKSLFTVCEVCQTLKADLSDKGLSFDQKLGALQLYRAHLHDQFCDRTVCWRLQSESADPSTDVLAICTDGLDQAKFALPRDPQLRASAALLPDYINKILFLPH